MYNRCDFLTSRHKITLVGISLKSINLMISVVSVHSTYLKISKLILQCCSISQTLGIVDIAFDYLLVRHSNPAWIQLFIHDRNYK